MFETGFLAGLLAKLAALGTAAKAAICTTTAAVTLTVAGAASGVIPVPGGAQPPGGSAGITATPVVDPIEETTPPATDAAEPAAGSASVSTGSTSANATAAASVVPTVPSIPGTPPLPDLPDLPDLPELPACVTSIVSSAMNNPDPSAIVSQVSGCVQTVLGSVNLPVDVSQCVASVMQIAANVAGGDLSGLSNIPQLVAGCLPGGMTIPGMGSIPGIGSIPGFDFGR